MALRDILAAFTIEVDDKQLKNANLTIQSAIDKVQKVGPAILGAFAVSKVADFVKGQIELGDNLVDTADKLGVSGEELQQWTYAAGLFGVSTESAGMGLQFLNKNVGLAITGNKEAAATFAGLDVALKNSDGSVRPLNDLLPELADSFAKMGSQQERTTKAQAIFGRSGAALLPILAKGSEGIKEMQGEFGALGGGLSKEFLGVTDKAGDNLFRLHTAMGSLKANIALAVIPTFDILVTKFTTAVSWASKLVASSNIAKIAFMAMGAAASYASLKVGAELAKAFGIVAKSSGVGIGGALKNLVSLGVRGGLIAAGIVLIALAIEDVYTMFAGGESVIGDFLDEVDGVGAKQKLIEDFTASWLQLTTALEPLKPLLKELFDNSLMMSLKTVSLMMGGIAQVLEWMASLMRGFVGLLNQVIADTAKLASAFPLLNAIPGFKSFVDKAANRAAPGVQEGIRNAAQFSSGGNQKETIGGLEASPFTYGPQLPVTASGGRGLSQTNQISVTVQGGGTPRETGQSVASGVREALDGHAQEALDALLTTGD